MIPLVPIKVFSAYMLSPSSFHLRGRMVPEFQAEDIREVIERPYRIIYRIKPEQIDVLAVIHGARQIDRHMIN